MEHAVEPVLVPVLIAVDVAPRAAIAGVVALDDHRQSTWSEPLHQQLRVDMRAEDDVPRRIELAPEIDERESGFRGDRGRSHGSIPSCVRRSSSESSRS
jgi:hypothetical protein